MISMRELVELLLGIKGKAVVSGYEHPLYSPFVRAGWKRIQVSDCLLCRRAGAGERIARKAGAHSLAKVPRTEVVWVKE
jgi:hypothetical protein